MEDEELASKKVHCPACIREGRLVKVQPLDAYEKPRYSPQGFEQEFPIDMGKDTMKIETLLTLGKNAFRSKDYEKAIYYYDQVLAKSPDHKEAAFFRKKASSMQAQEKSEENKNEDIPAPKEE
jgi:hypothetical protein